MCQKYFNKRKKLSKEELKLKILNNTHFLECFIQNYSFIRVRLYYLREIITLLITINVTNNPLKNILEDLSQL